MNPWKVEFYGKPTFLSRHDDFVMGVRYLFQNDLREFNFDSDLTSNPLWVEPVQNHIDLPRIREGRLGGQVIPFFWPRWDHSGHLYKHFFLFLVLVCIYSLQISIQRCHSEELRTDWCNQTISSKIFWSNAICHNCCR